MEKVDAADIYVGIYAYRYGWIPDGSEISITELEYNRAKERDIPRLIFLMRDDHPVKAGDVETGIGSEKLKNFKQQVKSERVVAYFHSATDLRGLVIQALSEHKNKGIERFHHITPIPQPPEPYIAHPYTLLQSRGLVGRRTELNQLTDWVVDVDSELYGNRVFCFVAIGGMGKSALTWHWFRNIAAEEMRPLVGRMWWSFYESDASFENFVVRALAYVSRRSLEDCEKIPLDEQQRQLWDILNREPYLIVLDGLERILIAYARLDAARMLDDDLDEKTANTGLPAGVSDIYFTRHRLRKTADPRTGVFLRDLTQLQSSRILITSRLYPADLQTPSTQPSPGCAVNFQMGLEDDDALGLWRSFSVSGARDELLPLFNSFQNHPLLIQTLAAEVAEFKPAPGDFDQWRTANPDFNPAALPLVQRRAHILYYALSGLNDLSRKVLHTIAGFRMPAGYDTLRGVLVGDGYDQTTPCPDVASLDKVLVELEDRGLVGWDRRSNRYDLHPIVRGVVWSGLAEGVRQEVLENLHTHFAAVPVIEDWKDVERLEDLTPAIELYDKLIGLGQYQPAYKWFKSKIDEATLWRLSASRKRIELLEELFPDKAKQQPAVKAHKDQMYVLNALALAYQLSGQPALAASLYSNSLQILENQHNAESTELAVGLRNLSSAYYLSGKLAESETAALRILGASKIECIMESSVFQNFPREDSQITETLAWIGLLLSARGQINCAKKYFELSLKRLVEGCDTSPLRSALHGHLAQHFIWLQEYEAAEKSANSAWELAQKQKQMRQLIRAARLQGEANLMLGDLDRAKAKFQYALGKARSVDFFEEEIPALTLLADLHRRKGEFQPARDLLNQVWEPAEQGPYPHLHADALNILAQIERDDDNHEKAVLAATKAYQYAWCDAPHYVYDRGLRAARRHLDALNETTPNL
jgi:tetratricopeptide (TPR) repeat protein